MLTGAIPLFKAGVLYRASVQENPPIGRKYMWLIYAVSWCLKIPVALYKLGGNKNKSTKLLRSKLCMKVEGGMEDRCRRDSRGGKERESQRRERQGEE